MSKNLPGTFNSVESTSGWGNSNNLGGGKASWIEGEEAVGGDNLVMDDISYPIWQIATAVSKVFEDREIDLDHIYIREPQTDLGKERYIVLFDKQTRMVCLNHDTSKPKIVCKSYDGNLAHVRLYNGKENFDHLAMETFGLAPDMFEDENNQMLSRFCEACPMKEWEKDDEGKWIKPRCAAVHEYYFVDVTNPQMELIPSCIAIQDRSKPKNDNIKEIDNKIMTKLTGQKLPIMFGVWKVSSKQVLNSENKKVPVWNFEFMQYLEDNHKNIYDFAKECYKELQITEDENKKRAYKRLEEEGDTIDVTNQSTQSQKGWAASQQNNDAPPASDDDAPSASDDDAPPASDDDAPPETSGAPFGNAPGWVNKGNDGWPKK